jgi:4-hydroxy-tetrahydrodipicolinate reductase
MAGLYGRVVSRTIKLLLAGHRGRVGSALEPLLRDADGIEYVGGVGRDDDLRAALANNRPDVLVDFTTPAAALDNALAAVAAGAAAVVGTSGLAPDAVDRLETACVERGVGGIVAPNFALGAVVMMHLAELAAPWFDAVEVIEMHHAAKLDSPSGTALATARRLAAARGDRPFDYRRPEKVVLEDARGGEEGGVAVHSVRLPGLVGDQAVMFGLAGQTLTITHRTTSRECYLPGVILAARHLVAEPAFYRGLDALLGISGPAKRV